MATQRELPILQRATRRGWRGWLETHHASSPGVWLKFAKKGAPVSTVTYGEAVEEALCFGWIDGQVRRHDEHFYLQRFTPRRPRSQWSQVNREKALRLVEEGRMAIAGLAQIEAAQADGRWQAAYEPQSRATVPPDFAAALESHSPAAEFFASLTGSKRYAFLYRLHQTAPARRAERIAHYIELLSAGKTLQDG